MLRLVALRVPPTTVDNDSTKFLQHSFVVSCLLHAPVGLFVSAIAPSGLSLSYLFDESSQSTIGSFLFWCFFCCCVPDVRLVCQWKPFWIRVEDSFKKAFVEEWVFISGEPSDGQNTVEVPMLHNTDHSEYIPVTPRGSKQ